MIDVHCHLNFHAFRDDTDAVIRRAQGKGVHTIINVGTKIDSSEHAIKLAETYENLYAIVGVHPHHADKLDLETDWLEKLEAIARHPKVIGIGECGMDYYSYASNGIVDPKLQRDVFEKQIELACRLKLPLQIHHRQVGMEIIDILNHHKASLLPLPGMFHCFAGDKAFLKKVLDLGFFIGFDGNLTYSGIAKGETTSLSEICSLVPLNRIVTETDSPFLTPEPHRGTQNEPMYIPLIVKYIADIKHVSFEDMVEQTIENSYTVFTKLTRHIVPTTS